LSDRNLIISQDLHLNHINNAAIDLCWITLKVEKQCPESQILCQIEKSVSDYGVFLIQYCWYVDTLVEDSGVRLEMFDCIDMYVV